MNAFQSRLLIAIARHPGVTANELALALGLEKLTWSRRTHLRFLENRGEVISMFVKAGGRRRVKVYRTKA